jgi:hypothetical protein
MVIGSTAVLCAAPPAAGAAAKEPAAVLGRPTDRSVALSVSSPVALEAFAELVPAGGGSPKPGARVRVRPGVPEVLQLRGLRADAGYTYRLRYRRAGERTFRRGAPRAFRTARAAGRTFRFTVQGDSHLGADARSSGSQLYARTLGNVARDRPDFHLLLGDDFVIDDLASQGKATPSAVDAVYARQRAAVATVGRSAPLFLVNGNHELGSRNLLERTPEAQRASSPPVLAANARLRHFPLPAPGAFYSGDAEPVAGIGLLRDYYAWTWGDALFVVIDPYWHSPAQVDPAGKERGGIWRTNRDWWGITIGDVQYRWLKATLEGSAARYKFVFAHHVMGTGRGGVEMAGDYEWGGRDPSGADLFGARRPGWELPIHQLMVRAKVSAFFQGHDHLYARQERDGVVYQTAPMPGDASYGRTRAAAQLRKNYTSGRLLTNSGHLRVTVGPREARVAYVRSYLPKDATATRRNAAVVTSYAIAPRP